MAKAIQKKAATLEQLERAEKEMTHLGARVQELRRQMRSARAPSSKALTGADIKEFCRQANLTLDVFTRLVGTSRRAVATWLAGNPPNRANERNLTELSRLFAALVELVPTAQIGSWLETCNSAFEGSTPVQVIERGESDRIWRMIWELRAGNSGD
jgi:DNA-binding transcriptional regulator YiaG